MPRSPRKPRPAQPRQLALPTPKPAWTPKVANPVRYCPALGYQCDDRGCIAECQLAAGGWPLR